MLAAAGLALSTLAPASAQAQEPGQMGAAPAPAGTVLSTNAPKRRGVFLEGDGWVPYALGSGALLATDRMTQPFLTHALGGSGTRRVARDVTFLGTAPVYLGVPAALYVFGGKHGRRTSARIATALVTSGVLTQAIKMAAGRRRPHESNGVGDFRGPSRRHESFPSGHTSAAFAVATVLAHEYPKHRGAFYGAAAAVGLSRVLLDKHFTSDVFVGGLIGVAAGQQAARGGNSILCFRF